jgi:protein gp37
LRQQKRSPWGELYRTKTWDQPAKWQAALAKHQAYRVFTCSLSDFFHHKADEWRPSAWDVIRATPNLVYLILTKRPERILNGLPSDWPNNYPNVWLGVSVGSRQTLNKMDTLRSVPIHPEALRWISAEPLLEDICETPSFRLDGFGWVVTGGESGPGAEYRWNAQADWRKEFNRTGRRTMLRHWAERLRDKTKARGLPFLFKQATDARSGQGSNLLGRVWHEFPPAHSGLFWAPRLTIEDNHQWTPVQIQNYDAAPEKGGYETELSMASQ